MYLILKRTLDLVLCGFVLIPLIPIYVLLSLFIKATSKGPVLHWSKRIGKRNKVFLMPKFRTMRIDTPQLATHLLTDSKAYLTPIGGLLRKLSLDETPQIISVFQGNMSIVGPRPALYNQDDLVKLRTKAGVHKLTPGITGWAQINGRDEIPISKKTELDKNYLENASLLLDLKIMALTVIKVIFTNNISH